MHLTTERLVIADVEASDLDGLLEVALSNPAFLATHEGTADGPGSYDRGMLERDLAVAAMDPARHPLALRRNGSDDVVGWAEVLDAHPVDGVPWVGLLELHAAHQRQGLGREAVGALLGWAGALGSEWLGLGVDADDAAAQAFWTALGAERYRTGERTSPLGRVAVDVLRLPTQVPG
ncbi:GNAT family N-acetyltransferase [Angustibacter aerolatus]